MTCGVIDAAQSPGDIGAKPAPRWRRRNQADFSGKANESAP
jgi:hypothetical protein